MPQLTTEKWIFIVEKYIEIKSFVTVQRNFESPFDGEHSCKKSIQNNVAKHRSLGKVWKETKEIVGEVNHQQLMKMLREHGRYWKTVPGQIYARQ